MGQDKALLEFGGATLLLRAVTLVRAAGGEPLVIGYPRPPEQVGGARQIDEAIQSGRPARGPLVALRWGLALCGTDIALVLACDLPCLTRRWLRFLVAQIAGVDAVVPRSGGRMHVLAAAYSIDCLAAIDRRLEAGERAVHAILPDLRLRIIEEGELERFGGPGLLTNVNTRDDLARLVAARRQEDA